MEPNILQCLYLLEYKDLYDAELGGVRALPRQVETVQPPGLQESVVQIRQHEAPTHKPIGFAGFQLEPAGEIRQFADSSSGILSRR